MSRRKVLLAIAIALPLALAVPLVIARSRQPRELKLAYNSSITLSQRDISGFFWRANGLFLTRVNPPLQKGPLQLRSWNGQTLIVRATEADESAIDNTGRNAALVYRHSTTLEHDLWDVEAGKSRGILAGFRGAQKLEHTLVSADQWAISPDGKRVAWKAPGTKGVRIGDALTARADATFETGVPDYSLNTLTFAPDSRKLAISSATKLWIVDARNGQLKRHWALNSREHQDRASWSPDGKYLALWWGHPYQNIIKPRVNPPQKRVFLRVFDAQTGVLVQKWTQTKSRIQSEGVTNASFSPDGKTLAFGTFDGNAHLMNLKTGQIERHFSSPSAQTMADPAHYVAFAPDGRTLAVATQSKIMLWRTD